MSQIKNIPTVMIEAAKKLGTGSLIYVYRDGQTIRAETEK